MELVDLYAWVMIGISLFGLAMRIIIGPDFPGRDHDRISGDW